MWSHKWEGVGGVLGGVEMSLDNPKERERVLDRPKCDVRADKGVLKSSAAVAAS